MPNDSALDVVNERLHRLESEVDGIKSDLNDQKVSVARITEQVAAHEKRGEERHQQILNAFSDMKNDYRMLFHSQAEDAKVQQMAERERSASQTKIILALLGIIASVIGAFYGFGPSSRHAEAPASATHTQRK